jgi:hypothetical protein
LAQFATGLISVYFFLDDVVLVQSRLDETETNPSNFPTRNKKMNPLSSTENVRGFRHHPKLESENLETKLQLRLSAVPSEPKQHRSDEKKRR